MDLATIIGLAGGAACIVMSVLTSGGTLGGIWDLPSFIMVLGGSYGAMLIAYPLNYGLGIFKIIARTFKTYDYGEKNIIQSMVAMSEKARREGILALEEGLDDLDNDFMKNGLRMVVDGTDGNAIRQIMEGEMSQCENRHMTWVGFMNAWAGLAPGYGMMGTVLGLIGMLNNLEDKSSLGPNMAVALITTLYGSMISNWIMIPISTKLQFHNSREMTTKEMIIEGVLSIQAGDNPRVLAMKLITYLDPKTKQAVEAEVLKD